ncbi:hypothetical protein GCM10009802_32880 [Streptomyces synnematoformans]|uniref:Uncharacterized protein n=1 Tax=Streptomyces synnematoformans TaxID=415721 RepID=A0ABN2YH46_9ACTN
MTEASATELPSGSSTVVRTITPVWRVCVPAFATSTRARTVALAARPPRRAPARPGVVTRVPQRDTCTGSVMTSRAFR